MCKVRDGRRQVQLRERRYLRGQGADRRRCPPAFAMKVNSEASQALYPIGRVDRKSTRLNSSHGYISYAVFCLKKTSTHAPGTLSQHLHGYILQPQSSRTPVVLRRPSKLDGLRVMLPFGMPISRDAAVVCQRLY